MQRVNLKSESRRTLRLIRLLSTDGQGTTSPLSSPYVPSPSHTTDQSKLDKSDRVYAFEDAPFEEYALYNTIYADNHIFRRGMSASA